MHVRDGCDFGSDHEKPKYPGKARLLISQNETGHQNGF